MAGELSDAQLVHRCRAGEAEAWNELVERFSRYVYAIAVRGFRFGEHDAEDVFQEVFVRVYDRLGSLRDDDALRPWIGQLTRRVCLDRLEAGSREEPAGEVVAADFEATIAELDEAFAVREALSGLSEECRGARSVLQPGRELPDDRRGSGDPVRDDRKPHLALFGEAAPALRGQDRVPITPPGRARHARESRSCGC